jgi:hypothetical protein
VVYWKFNGDILVELCLFFSILVGQSWLIRQAKREARHGASFLFVEKLRTFTGTPQTLVNIGAYWA